MAHPRRCSATPLLWLPISARKSGGAPSLSAPETLLELENVDVRYGGVQALRGISLTVQPGEIVALLGPNGAGKTTTLRAVSGLVAPSAGRITFLGRQIHQMRPED